MPVVQFRSANPTFVANQGNHVFQPSKYKCHDLTGPGWTTVTQGTGATVAAGGVNAGFYALNQPDNLTYNGEAENANVFYTASEASFTGTAGAQTLGVIPLGTYPPTTSIFNNRPVNRWPDSGQNSGSWDRTTSLSYPPGRGLANGGVTSTDFMFTKAPASNVLVTFFAYIDAQLNIMKVGQLEVLR
jgi:hypothetical protein